MIKNGVSLKKYLVEFLVFEARTAHCRHHMRVYSSSFCSNKAIMSASKRLGLNIPKLCNWIKIIILVHWRKELVELSSETSTIRGVQADESNILHWTAVLLPACLIYNPIYIRWIFSIPAGTRTLQQICIHSLAGLSCWLSIQASSGGDMKHKTMPYSIHFRFAFRSTSRHVFSTPM